MAFQQFTQAVYIPKQNHSRKCTHISLKSHFCQSFSVAAEQSPHIVYQIILCITPCSYCKSSWTISIRQKLVSCSIKAIFGLHHWNEDKVRNFKTQTTTLSHHKQHKIQSFDRWFISQDAWHISTVLRGYFVVVLRLFQVNIWVNSVLNQRLAGSEELVHFIRIRTVQTDIH